jgi:hypothetical protein
MDPLLRADIDDLRRNVNRIKVPEFVDKPWHETEGWVGGAAVSVADTFPWDKLAFGYLIDPDEDDSATVRIYSGRLFHGTRAPIEAIAEDVVFTPSTTGWAYVEYTPGSIPIFQIVGTAAVVEPVSTEETYRCWLYRFTVPAVGAPVLDKIGHMGNIEIPGMFA